MFHKFDFFLRLSSFRHFKFQLIIFHCAIRIDCQLNSQSFHCFFLKILVEDEIAERIIYFFAFISFARLEQHADGLPMIAIRARVYELDTLQLLISCPGSPILYSVPQCGQTMTMSDLAFRIFFISSIALSKLPAIE